MEIIIPFARLNPETLIFQRAHLCSLPTGKVLTGATYSKGQCE